MTTKNTGGPAFPLVIPPEHSYSTGMTLRDYFAAKAMQARLTRHPEPYPAPQWFGSGHEIDDARSCYAIADAMLKAREE